nr:penicillin acylase family protein [Arthrobacter sp. ISL-30]
MDDVEQALGRWVEPVNSVVAADRQGAVRHFLAGLVPQRHPDNRKLPVLPGPPSISGVVGLYRSPTLT